MTRTFDYGYTKVRNLYAVTERRRKFGKATNSAIMVEGEKTVPTKRFWRSFLVRFGISDSVFGISSPRRSFSGSRNGHRTTCCDTAWSGTATNLRDYWQ